MIFYSGDVRSADDSPNHVVSSEQYHLHFVDKRLPQPLVNAYPVVVMVNDNKVGAVAMYLLAFRSRSCLPPSSWASPLGRLLVFPAGGSLWAIYKQLRNSTQERRKDRGEDSRSVMVA
ncbi:hypothetical protein GW17_00012275 [Ensete ventricosum]|nr:hypothetical protein GW17_00012275 [Ensete ventricosum]RZS15655.1 hypothetical protein BHM03_00047517 [Ensete ventricosum]